MEEADPSPSSLGNYKPVRRHRVASPVGTVGKKRRRKLQKLVKTLADSNYFALPPLPPPSHPKPARFSLWSGGRRCSSSHCVFLSRSSYCNCSNGCEHGGEHPGRSFGRGRTLKMKGCPSCSSCSKREEEAGNSMFGSVLPVVVRQKETNASTKKLARL